MKIGIFGGTFDPPHQAHLKLAEAALRELGLDEVLFIPAHRNPHKTRGSVASARHRLEMVKLLIEENPQMAVSDLEVSRGGPSYAVETVRELQMARPADYWFLMGADAARDVATWKNAERLLQMCRLGIAIRPPMTEGGLLARLSEAVRGRVDLIRMPPMDLSASDLRNRLAAGQPVRPWIPSNVLDYIELHGLYKD